MLIVEYFNLLFYLTNNRYSLFKILVTVSFKMNIEIYTNLKIIWSI